MLKIKEDLPPLKFIYKNWQGETAERKIIPIKIWYGKTDFHPKKQWFLKALDLDKKAERDFAISDIQKFL
jgi:predicted DNA-binding transcriptional regulator YafY